MADSVSDPKCHFGWGRRSFKVEMTDFDDDIARPVEAAAARCLSKSRDLRQTRFHPVASDGQGQAFAFGAHK